MRGLAIALLLCFSLASCSIGSVSGDVRILEAWEVPDEDGPPTLYVAYRVAAGGVWDLESWGFSLSCASDKRTYWCFVQAGSALPAGASLTGVAKIVFGSSSEHYIEGSAAIVDFWCE